MVDSLGWVLVAIIGMLVAVVTAACSSWASSRRGSDAKRSCTGTRRRRWGGCTGSDITQCAMFGEPSGFVKCGYLRVVWSAFLTFFQTNPGKPAWTCGEWPTAPFSPFHVILKTGWGWGNRLRRNKRQISRRCRAARAFWSVTPVCDLLRFHLVCALKITTACLCVLTGSVCFADDERAEDGRHHVVSLRRGHRAQRGAHRLTRRRPEGRHGPQRRRSIEGVSGAVLAHGTAESFSVFKWIRTNWAEARKCVHASTNELHISSLPLQWWPGCWRASASRRVNSSFIQWTVDSGGNLIAMECLSVTADHCSMQGELGWTAVPLWLNSVSISFWEMSAPAGWTACVCVFDSTAPK